MAKENILIVGYTNSGKSTLANVLCDNTFFDENERTVRRSEDFQEHDFDWKGTKYHVVDIRVELTESEILYKIGRVIKSMPEGISRVLFVVDQRLTAEVVEKLKEIGNEISRTEISKYTTIMRTKFENFKSKDGCKKDEEELRSLNIFFNSLCLHIVHVDNPPTHIYVGNRDEEDDGMVNNNRKRREKSKIILLDHLEKVCKVCPKKYKLNMWDNMWDKLNNFDILDKVKVGGLVKKHLKTYDPVVADFIRKLTAKDD